jgi:hypothetical protein
MGAVSALPVAERRLGMAEDTPTGVTVQVPPDLAAKAEEKGWPLELLQQALDQGGQPADLMRFMEMGVSPEQVQAFLAGPPAFRRSGFPPPGQAPALDLSWMNVPTEWGVRARADERGLTLDAINVGSYGEVPEVWEHQTEMPRGAAPIPDVESMGYTIYQKQEVWSENAASLYEEGIQRRWRPATDVPWDTMEPLPDDIERAMCQLCTHLSEKAQLEADVLARWLPEISYGYHEVKLYLAATISECGRHADAFRKRALANGGGLGIQSPGWGFRSIVDARNYSEMVVIQMVLHDGFTLAQLAHGEAFAHNAAEKLIFRLAMQDKARHVAYGIGHLKHVLINRPSRRQEMERYLEKAEGGLIVDDGDTPTREAQAILLGGGKECMREGFRRLEGMRRRQVRDYLRRLEWATLEGHVEKLHPELGRYVN